MSMAMSGSFFTQFFHYTCIYNIYSIVQFVTSAFPSVWGCKAILNMSVMSNKDINSSQKCPQRRGSQSLIIYSRSLCWLTTKLRNLSAMVLVSDSCNGINCTILWNLLIACYHHRMSFILQQLGYKVNCGFTITASQVQVGGAYSPATFWVSDLKHWYISQFCNTLVCYESSVASRIALK